MDALAAPEHHEWGASLIPWQIDMKQNVSDGHPRKSRVNTVDLSKFVRTYISDSGMTTMMKMDVEGAEHTLLPHMIITGALCRIDVVVSEVHKWGEVTAPNGTTDSEFVHFFREYVEKYMYDPYACKTRFRTLDDETYGSSDFSLPQLLRRTHLI